MTKTIQVVAAVIKSEKGILVGQRKDNALWEFPGGKIEWGETPQEALKREIFEELGETITVGNICDEITHEYTEKNLSVKLTFFWATLEQEEVVSSVHSKLLWADKEKLKTLTFLEANQRIVKKLCTTD